MCSWKRQLEKTRNWKVLSGKVRYEIETIEVGEFASKLESSDRNWKVQLKLESD